jgi:4-amino-4-deoxy-L-arabinose transferase-like glycosyltransferase
MSTATPAGVRAPRTSTTSVRDRVRAVRISGGRAWIPAPELLALLVVAAVLDLWALDRNGWANTYYSAAVRSMAGSWHNFLYNSFDSAGVMTVDKPPLALWVQALSVRVFGFSSWSMLVPQALMGVGTVALAYDLTRRVFGRPAGFVAGLVLVLTPVTVAVSRHNNPDALVVLCCTAALWFTVRALMDGRTRWLVWAGVMVGLGFETKMGAALLVLPALAAAYLWVAPRGRLTAVRQLLTGGAAMAVVGLAWPMVMWLTPASSRPWISGTSDNSIWSLILNYNGVGRLDGQAGGPGGAAGGPGGGGGGGGGGMGSVFGGDTGITRLVDASLGGQAGWLIGMALAGGLAVAVLTRLRRGDARTGWIIAAGGAFLTTAVAFSFAKGIFHPYYVSMLAPFTAVLIGATAGTILKSGVAARIVAPVAIAGGLVTEVMVIHRGAADVEGLVPLAIVAGLGGAAVLAAQVPAKVRGIALAVALGALLIAPASWATQTLGHATSSTFPAGGPASQGMGGGGGPGGGGGMRGGPGGGFGGGANGGAPPQLPAGTGSGSSASGQAAPSAGSSASGQAAPSAGSSASGQAAPSAGSSASGQVAPSAGSSASGQAAPPAGFSLGGGNTTNNTQGAGGQAAGPGGGGMFGGNANLTEALAYAKSHGGGTIGVSSQQGASDTIIRSGADVAALGGFSGRESEVSATWLAQAVKDGRIRYVLTDGTGGGMGNDSRVGSSALMAVVQKVGKETSVSGLYDLQGQAAAIAAAA